MGDGVGPENLLCERYSNWWLDNEVTDLENSPTHAAWQDCYELKGRTGGPVTMGSKIMEMPPLKLLLLKSMDFNLSNWANSRGTMTEKLLLLMWRETRKDRFPKCGGMVPSKDVTLWCRELQVFPIQLQIGVELDQFGPMTFWGSLKIWNFRARRAEWSVVMLEMAKAAVT